MDPQVSRLTLIGIIEALNAVLDSVEAAMNMLKEGVTDDPTEPIPYDETDSIPSEDWTPGMGQQTDRRSFDG